MPISQEKEWYQEAGIKKPQLQIKILRHIGLEGQLSKSMAQDITKSDYSDVSNAIDSLMNRQMIRVSSLSMPGRRDKRYYGLTGKGLNAFINDIYSSTSSKSHSSEEFWKSIIWFCILNSEQSYFSKIEDVCYFFESAYLGHPAINSYLFQSRFFDKLVNNWIIKNNGGVDDNTTSFSQKILESMSLNRNITLQQLCQITGELECNVRKDLDKLTVKGCSCIIHDLHQDVNISTHSESKHPNLDHMLIIARKSSDSHDTTYELSLFGVMLTIALVRYHHIGLEGARLHIPNGHANKVHLFFKSIPLNDYFDKIAFNYNDKIPLIFGKWNLLKKEVGDSFLYRNFDFLLYAKAFAVNMGTSIWLGGNKEFCDNLQALADKSSQMLKVLHTEGKDILNRFIKHASDKDKKYEFKLMPLYIKLNEIETILMYLNNESFSDILENKINSLQNKMKTDHEDDNLYPDSIFFMERVFSNELTFFYYLNLNNTVFTTTKSYSQDKEPIMTDEGPDIDDLLSVGKDIFSRGSPKQRLTRILQKDEDIKQHFCNWIDVLLKYQQETSEKMIKNFKLIDVEK